MNPKVDQFLVQAKNWREELSVLRSILMNFPLEEEVKWGSPCYMFGKNNVIIIHGFKEYFGLLFFKGALMKDPHQLLVKPGENTQAGRQMRFKSMEELVQKEDFIKEYVLEAIELEKAGAKVILKNPSEFSIPTEFQTHLNNDNELKTAFEKLTPGRQKAYCMYFADSKQSQTRENRIEKYIPRILSGKGMTDCTCGLSKKMPACDGSHRSMM
ncbi:DUF1801 domain-containing protein [Aquirufa sp. ROCK-SH2]